MVCSSDADCNSGDEIVSHCAVTPANDGQRYCNHRDVDQDGVGDACDTCVFAPNPMQVTESGMAIDDEDGDFVGAPCETNTSSGCDRQADARRIGFYDLSAGGQCCVVEYPGDDQVYDPAGIPIRRECSESDEEAGICRKLPSSVLFRPGIVELPLGCSGEGTPLTLADVGGDPLALWASACLLPQSDQDFDGIGDRCDLCPFGYDPSNEPYTDDEGTVWDNFGSACAGPNSPEHVPGALCPRE